MFGISLNQWRDVCDMYLRQNSPNLLSSYLQWYPYIHVLNKIDGPILKSLEFFTEYIKNGKCLLFPSVTFKDKNYILKSDGTFRNATLISPLMYLLLQSIGKTIYDKYPSSRPDEIVAYYGGDYYAGNPHYKLSYHSFYDEVKNMSNEYGYYIKTDIKDFYDNINLDKLFYIIDSKINAAENQQISPSQLYLYKRLFSYCGDGHFPLVENSICSSYLSTIVYLEEADIKLYEYLSSKKSTITRFKMIRYVDDLYIFLDSNESPETVKIEYVDILNQYNSILKDFDLSLNFSKCTFKEIMAVAPGVIFSLYDDWVVQFTEEIPDPFPDGILHFLRALEVELKEKHTLTFAEYQKLVSEVYSSDTTLLQPQEIFNNFVYSDLPASQREEVTNIFFNIINQDITSLRVDPKRLMFLILQTYNGDLIKSTLRLLFSQKRTGVWNYYDSALVITYLSQRRFCHEDLLRLIDLELPQLAYYSNSFCEKSFLDTLMGENSDLHNISKIISEDQKVSYLYFMYKCEESLGNFMEAFAYFKNFFDRVTADIRCRNNEKINYKKYFNKTELLNIYSRYNNGTEIIEYTQALRNHNPLAHASSELLDDTSSTTQLEQAQKDLWELLIQYCNEEITKDSACTES